MSIKLFFLLAVFFGFASAQKNISSSEDVFGEYCFTEDEDKTDHWVLEKYKSNKPYLFSYSQCSYDYRHSILPDYDYFFLGPISMIVNSVFDKAKPARCMPNHYSEKMVYESYEKTRLFISLRPPIYRFYRFHYFS